MSDLINRADAIEAVRMSEHRITIADEQGGVGTVKWDMWGVYTAEAVEAIKVLPSADITETETCQRCQESIDTILNRQGERIKVLEASAEAVQGWRIGKPTEQNMYIVTVDSMRHGMVELMYYGKPLIPNVPVNGMCWYRSDDEWGDVVYDDKDILAWMPLPEPYKGGEDE